MIEAIIYSDSSVKDKYCGIAVAILDNNGNLIKTIARRVIGLTNDNTAAEGRAIIQGIKAARKMGFKNIRIYSDSKSLIQVANSGRASKPATKGFLQIVKYLRTKIAISFKWVRGHAGKKWNELCDKLARNAEYQFHGFLDDVLMLVYKRWIVQKLFPRYIRLSATALLSNI